jgi:hypothetical protein
MSTHATNESSALVVNPYIIDPYFASLLPALPAENFARLKANIAADGGCLCPVIVWDEKGILIDGHHRDRADGELRAEQPDLKLKSIQVIRKSFASKEEAVLFVLNHQDGQRPNWNNYYKVKALYSSWCPQDR